MIRGHFSHGEIDNDGFRLRGYAHVYRVESFSDAVFAFAVTLLVVSLEVPKSFNDLVASLSGFIGFAFGFALLVSIWFTQNRFFRRYGLHDIKTITLTGALLFLVVLFTYPLKFLTRMLVLIPSGADVAIRVDQIWQLFLIYGLGYAAVFVIFALLYRHALSMADALELTPLERAITKTEALRMWAFILAPVLSIALAVILHARGQDGSIGLVSGFIYPIAITLGIAIASRYGRREQS